MTTTFTNDEIASTLNDLAFLQELESANPFKIKAYLNAARKIEELASPASELLATGELAKTPGIGKGILALLTEFFTTGKITELEEIKAKYPPTLMELRRVRGLGAKKIKTLYTDLFIASLGELEYACNENRLVELKGFGEKTQASVLKAIQLLKSAAGKVLLPVAESEAEEILEELRAHKSVVQAEPTGELRRKLDVISQLEFLVEIKKDFTAELKSCELGEKIAGHEAITSLSMREGKSPRGVKVKVYFLSDGSLFPQAHLQLTGSQAFLDELKQAKAAIGIKSEAEFFEKIHLPWIPPEAREAGALPAAKKGLLNEKDIRGVFHMHTLASDGKDSLEAMALSCIGKGYEYMGVSEHSQSAFYARGLTIDRVHEQREEIARLQKKYPKFKIFHGIESDILSDGALDYPDKILKEFDFVIASVHGGFRMSREDMTKRLVRAVENPYTTWLGHMTGRLLLSRAAYEFDLDKVLKAAGKAGCGIELNSNPYRLDMAWETLPLAKEHGISIGVFPDAHSVEGLNDTHYGVIMARKGGLAAADVTNTKNLEEMTNWLQKRK